MSRGITVTAKHDKSMGAWSVHFQAGRYDWSRVKAILEVMKMKVPSSDRDYDPTTKTWTILEKHWDFIKQIVVAASFDLKEEKEVDYQDFFYNTAPEAHIESHESLHAKLEAILGKGFTKKTYLRKALEWHPDRNGGDGSKMSELNSLWSAYNA
jgi:predicted NAD-dependent protein-ADP-ribosyltransferase YbiA (DUF1768 family)